MQIDPKLVKWDDQAPDPSQVKWDDAPAKPEPLKTLPVQQFMGNLGSGLIRGAGSIGATLLTPYDMLAGNTKGIGNPERRQAMDAGLQSLGFDPSAPEFGVGKLTGEIAGTMGVGGAIANTAARVPAVARNAGPALDAIRTAGMSAGGQAGARSIPLRMAGGAVAGAGSVGLVNPEDAKTGAAIGAAFPPLTMLGAKAGQTAGSVMRGTVAPEVASLAKRAKELGIDIPADRLAQSKPLDAVAAGLNYVPFSGRAATESRMGEQLNRAASRLIGQDTPNMMQALRKAGDDLGAKFDTTLRNTGVAVDKQMLDDVARVFNVAERELGSDGLKPIASQVDELMAKAGNGVIDGQAAYNIKRTLDRIGRGNRPEAFHALELKGVLMDALNRSLGPDGAKAFATTRQQYGNMLALEKLAKNGVEGEISVARLANMRNINNQPLQELADIASQFVKAREGQHGGAQRALVGMGLGSTMGPLGLAAGAAAGRGVNSLLNSGAVRNTMLGAPNNGAMANALMDPTIRQAVLRAAPLSGSDR